MQNRSISPSKDYHSFSFERPFIPYGEYFSNCPSCEFEFMHAHNCLEIGYLKKGSGVFNIDDKIISVKAPSVCIIYEGQLHSAQSSPLDKSEWCFLYLDVSLATPHIDKGFMSALRCFSYRQYEFKNVIEKSDDELIFSLVKTIITEAAEKGRSHLKIIEGALFTLLSAHSATMTRRSDKYSFDSEAFVKIENAVNYINGHFGEKIRIPHLASLCYMSESSLRRLFVRFCGLSPENYIHKVRTGIAASRLLSGRMRILDIALECGYTSISSFNRQFIRFYKTSPSAFRKQNMSGESD